MTVSDVTQRFAPVPADQPADELEQALLARWREEDLFARTLAARAGAEPFVFFEGPPTANGKPGIHHVFARTIKDLFCRHRAMKGYLVHRKAGWDTHGLPVEIEVEKQLGISGKQDIEKLGVAEFNRLCRESVFTYRGDWERLSERIGYWLDYDDPYVTYTPEYVESVWWALATLLPKGAALSRPQDPAVLRALRHRAVEPRGGAGVRGRGGSERVRRARPRLGRRRGRAGCRRDAGPHGAPHPRVDDDAVDARVEHGARRASRARVRGAAKDRQSGYAHDHPGRGASGRGAGRGLRHALDAGADADRRGARRRAVSPAASTGCRFRRARITRSSSASGSSVADDGSGVVHMAPAFGADDYAAGRRHNLAFLQPVNPRGEFPEDLPLVGGQFVKHADPALIEELKRRGVLWKAGTMSHSYPHCWRCGTPLLYYARTSWFVRTTAYKDEMLARNARVGWHPPQVGSGRFGEWLENNIDWAISRDRYWGTPLPVWVCDRRTPTISTSLGSYRGAERAHRRAAAGGLRSAQAERRRARVGVSRAGCGGTMRRMPEVIDTWFDSGSMPFAQWHYPFENRDALAARYPARLHRRGARSDARLVLLAARDRDGAGRRAAEQSASDTAAPYRSVVVNDLVLDAEGRKMSKTKGNVVEPWGVIQRHGVDAVRLFLVGSSKVWEPRSFDENQIRQGPGRFLLTLKHIYSGMFAQYANFGWSPSAADPAPADRPLLDRWILSRLATVERAVDEALLDYDATVAVRALIEFVDEDVANWYVRQSRKRFYDVDTADNRAAFATLHEVLVVVCRLLAPFAPFVTDWLHRELTGESVHLAPFVRDGGASSDQALEAQMASIRTLATLGRAAREQAGINVRQPLSRLVCVAPRMSEASLAPLLPILASELNVKHVEVATSADALVTLEAKANFRVARQEVREADAAGGGGGVELHERAPAPVRAGRGAERDGGRGRRTRSRRTISRSCVAPRARWWCRKSTDISRRSIPR